MARKSYWCINKTMEAAGFTVRPYHALVPSFGEWGFVIASRATYAPPAAYEHEHRFLTPEQHPALFAFPKDMARVPTAVNRLNNQVLVQYYEAEWKRAPVE
jgi:spermidine synthase